MIFLKNIQDHFKNKVQSRSQRISTKIMKDLEKIFNILQDNLILFQLKDLSRYLYNLSLNSLTKNFKIISGVSLRKFRFLWAHYCVMKIVVELAKITI